MQSTTRKPQGNDDELKKIHQETAGGTTMESQQPGNHEGIRRIEAISPERARETMMECSQSPGNHVGMMGN
jgi:hypothetical protein